MLGWNFNGFSIQRQLQLFGEYAVAGNIRVRKFFIFRTTKNPRTFESEGLRKNIRVITD